MPNSSESGIHSTTGVVIHSSSGLLEVYEALSAKTGFQASKVRSFDSNLSAKHSGRVPFNPVVSFLYIAVRALMRTSFIWEVDIPPTSAPWSPTL
eukprot:3309935-Amphidinium_carterae.1